MAFLDDCLAEARDIRDEQIKTDLYTSLYLDGATDAAFGRLPEYADPVYLEGYCNKLKELPRDPETGKIQHYTPRQHFAFGYMDGSEKFCTYNDEF
jgi:hypothetical protein